MVIRTKATEIHRHKRMQTHMTHPLWMWVVRNLSLTDLCACNKRNDKTPAYTMSKTMSPKNAYRIYYHIIGIDSECCATLFFPIIWLLLLSFLFLITWCVCITMMAWRAHGISEALELLAFFPSLPLSLFARALVMNVAFHFMSLAILFNHFNCVRALHSFMFYSIGSGLFVCPKQ